MKKHLFVAALATMAVAACTQEDFESTSQSAGQVSPIKFTVTADMDAQTKAEFNNKYAVLFKTGDQMSLFHGIGTTPIANINSFTPSYVEDAIYKATGDEEGGLTFTTHSMVKPGAAIMVYPCDTTFQYLTDKGLYVTIPTEQTKENVLGRIPLMSELLTIPEWEAYNPETGAGSSTAGYGRDYNISLKQVATVFELSTNYGVSNAYSIIKGLEDNGEIAPITIDKVTIESSLKFNNKALVKYEEKATGQGDNWPTETADGFAWSHVSNVWTKADKNKEVTQVASLSSKFIGEVSGDEMGKVNFILLPQENAEGAAVSTLTGKITVNTYYGQVAYDESKKIGGRNIMYKNDWEVENYLNVAAGLNNVIGFTTMTKKTSGSKFYNEPVGALVRRILDVDLYDLDMSKVHIKTDEQLQDILKVYDALNFDTKYSAANPLVLTVDGDKVDHKFRMSMESVRTLQSENYKAIRINPCNEAGEVCNSIVLYHDAESDVVPSIQFVVNKAISIVLDGEDNWTWENGRGYSYISTLINEGTLNFDNGDVVLDADGYNDISILNNGRINVSGLVKQQCSLNNFGTINIAEGAEYRADGKVSDVEITNDATSATTLGTIYNSGIFATTNGGTINNYGYIENMLGTSGNMTYVTTNSTTDASFNEKWDASTNKIGTIKLKTAGDNISVSNTTNQGFIQYEYTGTDYVTPEVCKYNYLIVKDDITFSAEATEVMYLEIQNSSKTDMPVLTNPSAERFLNLTGFILKGYANLKENNKLVAEAAYIEGALYYGGLFCQSGQTTTLPETQGVYFGNSVPAAGDNTYLVEY